MNNRINNKTITKNSKKIIKDIRKAVNKQRLRKFTIKIKEKCKPERMRKILSLEL